jgi:hypothetical protein
MFVTGRQISLGLCLELCGIRRQFGKHRQRTNLAEMDLIVSAVLSFHRVFILRKLLIGKTTASSSVTETATQNAI